MSVYVKSIKILPLSGIEPGVGASLHPAISRRTAPEIVCRVKYAVLSRYCDPLLSNEMFVNKQTGYVFTVIVLPALNKVSVWLKQAPRIKQHQAHVISFGLPLKIAKSDY